MGSSASSQHSHHRTSRASSFQQNPPATSPHNLIPEGREQPSSFFHPSAPQNGADNNDHSDGSRPAPDMEDYYEYVEDTEDARALKAHVNSASTSVITSNPNPLLTDTRKSTSSSEAANRVSPDKNLISMITNKKSGGTSAKGDNKAAATKQKPVAITTTTEQTPNAASLKNHKAQPLPPRPRSKDITATRVPPRQASETSTPPVTASSTSHPYHYESADGEDEDDVGLFMLVKPGGATPLGSSSYRRPSVTVNAAGGAAADALDDIEDNWSMFSDTDLGPSARRASSSDGSPRMQDFKNFIVDPSGSPMTVKRPPQLGDSILKGCGSAEYPHSPVVPNLAHRASRDGQRISMVVFSETVEEKPKKSRRGSASRGSLSGSAGKRPLPKYHKLQPISSTYELGRKLSSSGSFMTSSITMEGVAAEEAKVFELLYSKMERPASAAAGGPSLLGQGPRRPEKPKVSRNYRNPDNIDPDALTMYSYKGKVPLPQPDPNGPITNVYHEGEVKIPLTSFLGFEFAKCERVMTPVGMDLDVHTDEDETPLLPEVEGEHRLPLS